MPTPKLNLSLTVHEVNQITKVIRDAYDNAGWSVRDQVYTNDDGRVVDYRVESAEHALVKRDHYADLIELLTGEHLHDDAETRTKVATARRQLDAQTAADQVAETQEV